MQRVPDPLMLCAALLAGASYWPASHVLDHGAMLAVWKGAGVGLLALWALRAGGSGVTRWIAAVLACGALGDVLLETSGLSVGAVAFLAGHVLAAALYWRERRRSADGTTVAGVMMLGVPVASYIFSGQTGVLFYSLGLGAMTATAWVSRFPRRWVGAGALLFAGSDLLIFARIGPLAGSALPGLLIWPLYLAGQAMIAYGVVMTERVR